MFSLCDRVVQLWWSFYFLFPWSPSKTCRLRVILFPQTPSDTCLLRHSKPQNVSEVGSSPADNGLKAFVHNKKKKNQKEEWGPPVAVHLTLQKEMIKSVNQHRWPQRRWSNQDQLSPLKSSINFESNTMDAFLRPWEQMQTSVIQNTLYVLGLNFFAGK